MCRFYDASVFETIIRILGGMLTAHELSGDAGFLTRCSSAVPCFCAGFHDIYALATNVLCNSSRGHSSHAVLLAQEEVGRGPQPKYQHGRTSAVLCLSRDSGIWWQGFSCGSWAGMVEIKFCHLHGSGLACCNAMLQDTSACAGRRMRRLLTSR